MFHVNTLNRLEPDPFGIKLKSHVNVVIGSVEQMLLIGQNGFIPGGQSRQLDKQVVDTATTSRYNYNVYLCSNNYDKHPNPKI